MQKKIAFKSENNPKSTTEGRKTPKERSKQKEQAWVTQGKCDTELQNVRSFFYHNASRLIDFTSLWLPPTGSYLASGHSQCKLYSGLSQYRILNTSKVNVFSDF